MVCHTGKILRTLNKQRNKLKKKKKKIRRSAHLILPIHSVTWEVEILVFQEGHVLTALFGLGGSEEEATRECSRFVILDFLNGLSAEQFGFEPWPGSVPSPCYLILLNSG